MFRTERASETCGAIYKNKYFEKQMHLVGCTIRIYYDTRTYERQIYHFILLIILLQLLKAEIKSNCIPTSKYHSFSISTL